MQVLPKEFGSPRFHRNAAILSIGDELVLGQTLDTNSRWLSEQLVELGVRPAAHMTVEDSLDAIIEAIESLAYDHDLILVTGGLGPTLDDLTRESLGEVLDRPLVIDEGAQRALEAWSAARGRELNELNRRQAMRPSSAITIPNPNGTAPGIAAVIAPDPELDREGHTLIVCLPGPPRENQPMFRDAVVPMLRPQSGDVIRTRLLRHFGIPESVAAERLGAMMRRDANPTVGTTASGGIVSVRIRYEGNAGNAEIELDNAAKRVHDLLSPHGFGHPPADRRVGAGEHASLAEVTLRHLRERSESLVVAESCTGGLLGAMITGVPGSSDSFLGGWQTYSNAMKKSQLGVPGALIDDPSSPGFRGAVSRETAIAMAVGALEASARAGAGDGGAHHALAITGVAGPDGGTPDKPVGTVWIARASRDASAGGRAGSESEARRFLIAGDREDVRERSAMTALAMLLFHLRGDAVPMLTWQVADSP
ncbi:MAG: CinA family nicotinamide mononucleotide deamidase-related protein [Phycisphaerales bacterium]